MLLDNRKCIPPTSHHILLSITRTRKQFQTSDVEKRRLVENGNRSNIITRQSKARCKVAPGIHDNSSKSYHFAIQSIMSSTTTTTTQTQEQPPLVLRQNAEAGPNLNEYDEEQARLMEERCILVTPEDVAYGEDSKKTCTLLPCVPGEELIHRPLDDKHQQRAITSCFLRIPLQTIRWKTPTPEKGG
jgi:hypothetical protein